MRPSRIEGWPCARRSIGLAVLAGLLALGLRERICGPTPDDVLDRAETAFVLRALLEGCGLPVRAAIGRDEHHRTGYGQRFPSPARWLKEEIRRVQDDTAIGRVAQVDGAIVGRARALSFPGQAAAPCYDNLLIPVELRLILGRVPTLRFTIVLRVSQAHFGSHSLWPVVGHEATGWAWDRTPFAPSQA